MGYYNLIKGHNCFHGKCTLIDLILTNRKFSVKNTQPLETGLSDRHHMVYTMPKTIFQKSEPKQLIYRDFINFCFESFNNDLLENMVTCDRYDEFDRKITMVLNKSSKLKNKANKTKKPSDIKNYKK